MEQSSKILILKTEMLLEFQNTTNIEILFYKISAATNTEYFQS